MDHFIEYADNFDHPRDAVCLLTEFPKLIKQAQAGGTVLYRSFYTFPAAFRDYVKQNGSVRGYSGLAYVDRLAFDIDRGRRTDDEVLNLARSFVLELEEKYEIYIGHIQPWFSGTGYHIQMYDAFGFAPGTDIPTSLKATMQKLFPDLDHSIYNRTSLLRAPHTRNQKTGLYKIPLLPNELLTMSSAEIMELAKNPRMDFRWTSTVEPPTRHLSNLIVETAPKKIFNGIESPSDSNGIVTCMQKLFAHGQTVGSRHDDIMRMASAWRRGGVPFGAAASALREWASSMDGAEVTKIVSDVYLNGFMYSCNDHLMVKWCDPNCIFFKHKNYAVDIASSSQMESNYVKFVNTNFENSSFDLSEFYEMTRPYRVLPGELVIVFGDTGTGKTAWIQNLCVKLKRMDILYLSLEVNQTLIYRRFIQIEHRMTRENVEDYYKVHSNHLSDAIRHIQCITMAVDIQTVHRLIAEMRPRIVVIDVIDGINVKGFTDANTKSMIIARELKQIAIAQNVIIIGIHHISKGAAIDKHGNPKTLDVHSGAYSSSLEQKADKVIGIEGNRDEPFRVVTGLKARDETGFQLAFKVDPNTFIFEQQL
jgi:hypothetical protein